MEQAKEQQGVQHEDGYAILYTLDQEIIPLLQISQLNKWQRKRWSSPQPRGEQRIA